MKALAVTLDLGIVTSAGVPVIPAGTTLASGYYTDPNTGNRYYYNARQDQWYLVSGLSLIPLAISWQPSPSAKLNIAVGEKLRFNLSFYYIGPAVTKTLYAALGDNKTSGTFSEWAGTSVTKDIQVPACAAKTLITGQYVDIVISGAWGHNAQNAAAYCKVINGITLTEGVNCTPYYYDVCYIIETAGEITNFAIASFVKA